MSMSALTCALYLHILHTLDVRVICFICSLRRQNSGRSTFHPRYRGGIYPLAQLGSVVRSIITPFSYPEKGGKAGGGCNRGLESRGFLSSHGVRVNCMMDKDGIRRTKTMRDGWPPAWRYRPVYQKEGFLRVANIFKLGASGSASVVDSRPGACHFWRDQPLEAEPRIQFRCRSVQYPSVNYVCDLDVPGPPIAQNNVATDSSMEMQIFNIM
ncbi:hypothetical protein GGR56DRAFT_546702 [Xylariaceae sp. FL0804]|nr:hypothetical protein GGR56DRAFT_546702 [Xylariaceae sp. FL0804]